MHFIKFPLFLILNLVETRSFSKTFSKNYSFFINLQVLLAHTLIVIGGAYIYLDSWKYYFRELGGFPLYSFEVSNSLGLELLKWLVALAVLDFFQYWAHFAMHKIPFLWKIHKIHHSDETMNSTTAARLHIGELFISLFLVYMPLFTLFDFNFAYQKWFFLFLSTWTILIHCSFRLPFNHIIEQFVTTPDYHLVHHTSEEKAFDMNFANYFPFWDRLFGTYYGIKKDEDLATGVKNYRMDNAGDMFLIK